MPAGPKGASAWPSDCRSKRGCLTADPGLPGRLNHVADTTFGWNKKLRKADEFSSVFHLRCARRGQVLDISAGANALNHARLGLIVAKRVIPTAAARNRLKRLIREYFRLSQSRMPGLDIVARVRRMPDNDAQLRDDFSAGVKAAQACVERSRGGTGARVAEPVVAASGDPAGAIHPTPIQIPNKA